MIKQIYPKNKPSKEISLVMATNRKYNACENICKDDIQQHCNTYYFSVKTHTFSSIVFDFDLTVHNKAFHSTIEDDIFQLINLLLKNDIKIGIATGNGEYVAEEIKKRINPEFWHKVIIGYYNGGLILPLDSTITYYDLDIDIPYDFKKLIDFINLNIPSGVLVTEGIKEENPFQINFFSEKKDHLYIDKVIKYIYESTKLKIIKSPHSYDVVPSSTSKVNVCDYFCDQGLSPDDIITIGDYGAYGESDYELLNRKFSLSVNTVSDSLINCWNFSPENKKNLKATLNYLEHIRFLGNGKFIFDI